MEGPEIVMSRPTDMKDLKIAVLGTGANGAGIGADIARAGLDVTFIDQWPANVEAIRKHGIRVEVDGETQITPVRALHLCDVATLVEPFDAVLLLVKAYDTRWACELIKPHVAPTGFVMSVQNGTTGEAVVDVMGEERGLDAVIEITSAMYEPGRVERHSGFARSWFAVGAPRPAAQKHVPLAAALLRHAGTVEEVDDIRSPKWMKLVLNAGELVPSAILDLSIVDCARINSMRPIMVRAGDEAIRFAKEEGLEIRPIFGMEGAAAANPDTFMQTILDELVAHYVKPISRSTFLQDWIKGRHCEVDEINGAVVRGLARYGLNAPVNQALLEFAHDIERGIRQRGLHNLEPMLARIEALDAEAATAGVRSAARDTGG
jgi:2-dehydropantoate 2-reductase